MKKDIVEWARACLPCQRSKISRYNRNIPEHIPIPDDRFGHVHIDIVGPLPPSRSFRYCLTIIDRFTRWPEAVPISDITAETVVNAFFACWISRYGAPVTITTDRGSQFESTLFNSLLKFIGCERIRTTSYHPASNGMVKRWHRSLKSSIMCHQTTEWVDSLPIVLLGLRTSLKEDIKTTCAELVFGTTLRLPGEFLIDYEGNDTQQIYVQRLRTFMRGIRPVPTAHHSKARLFVHKNLYDCTHVFLKNDAKRSLEHPFEGPYKVIERVSDNVFKILVNDQAITVSTERLKPAFIEATPECQEEMVPSQGTSYASQPAATYFSPPVTSTSPTVPTSSPQSARQATSPSTRSTSTAASRKIISIPVAPPSLTPRPDVPPRTYAGAKNKKNHSFRNLIDLVATTLIWLLRGE